MNETLAGFLYGLSGTVAIALVAISIMALILAIIIMSKDNER
jgi:hypothetical protein